MVDPIVIERKKLFEHVASHLEAQILAGKLRPGDQLPPERDLQARFGVGRPAIREALISLQKAGLVELTNGARARVLMPTASHIFTGMAPAVRQMLSTDEGQRHFQGARMFFEVGLAREAAKTRDRGRSRCAEAALDANRKAIGDRDPLHRTDIAFHFELAQDRPQSDLHRAARPDLGMADRAARRYAHRRRAGAHRLQCAQGDLRGDRRTRRRQAPRRRCATTSSSSPAPSGSSEAKADLRLTTDLSRGEMRPQGVSPRWLPPSATFSLGNSPHAGAVWNAGSVGCRIDAGGGQIDGEPGAAPAGTANLGGRWTGVGPSRLGMLRDQLAHGAGQDALGRPMSRLAVWIGTVRRKTGAMSRMKAVIASSSSSPLAMNSEMPSASEALWNGFARRARHLDFGPAKDAGAQRCG